MGHLIDRLEQEHLTRLLVDHLACGNIEHKTWGIAVFLSLNALLVLVGSLGGLTFSRHLGGSWVVLGDRFTVTALQTKYDNLTTN